MKDLLLEPTKVDFQSLANKIANDFYSGGTPLTEGVVKVAQENNFNPEEVKRLVEKTNTAAVLNMLKTAEDKKGTIPVVHYEEVLTRTHPEETTPEPVVKIAFELPETRKKRKKQGIDVFEKNASYTPKSYSRKTRMPEVFKKKQEIEKLSQEKIAAELNAQDGLDYLVSEFYKYKAPSFTKFAAEACSITGDKAITVLDKIANYLSESDDYKNYFPDYVIDDRNPLLQKFASVMEDIEKIAYLDIKRQQAKEELNTLWKEVCDNAVG